MVKKYPTAILIFLISLEILLRLTGVFTVYSEKIGLGYQSDWGFKHKTHFKIMRRNSEIHYEQKELTISFQSNSLGMRNGEISLQRPDSVYRIICLGDSYTEGDGAPFGHSYPRQLEMILNDGRNGNQHYEVINAGKNGSDIIYAQKLLTTVLVQLRPDLVIMAINDSDLHDIIQRDGPERFKSDNTTAYQEGPWYEQFYQYSHVFRFLIHIPLRKNKLFLSPKADQKKNKEAVEHISNSMSSLIQFGDEQNIDIRFIIHPTSAQVNPERNKQLRKHPNDTDAAYEKSSHLYQLRMTHRDHSYDLYRSLTESLSELAYTEYAWPINGHYNAYGYGVLAEQLVDRLFKDEMLGF